MEGSTNLELSLTLRWEGFECRGTAKELLHGTTFEMASRAFSTVRRTISARGTAQRRLRRFFGGESHHGEGEARLFGDSKWEGWEPIVYVTYAASALVLIVGISNKPQTSILQWAREEALARMKIEDDGGEVEFGTHYAKEVSPPYAKEEVGEMPTVEEEE